MDTIGVLLLISVIITTVIMLGILFYHITTSIQTTDTNASNNTTINMSCPKEQVCMSKKEYNKLIDMTSNTSIHETQPIQQTQHMRMIPSISRDERVLYDQLYPPLNRIDSRSYDEMNVQITNRNMYVPLNDIGDRYRLVGYLTSDEDTMDKGGNAWKLFARQKDRHVSDFYIIPANKNYDLKISIKDDMVVGTRLRDIYTIPSEIRFKSPFLHATPYQFVENEKTDYTSSIYN